MRYIDLERAFDTVPKYRMMTILTEYYGLNRNIVETVHRIYTDVLG